MQKLWEFEDYVGHLKHANSSVRSWAFDAVESHFPRRFAAEAAGLIGDENEHLACMAPRYLAKHHAVQFAPEILESFNIFKNSFRYGKYEIKGSVSPFGPH
jgi:hypothetical protein